MIQENSLIREEYKLQFQATLGGSAESVAEPLFYFIKQNSGEFRGEDESYNSVKKIADKYDFNKKAEILKFVSELHQKIVNAAGGDPGGSSGITPI